MRAFGDVVEILHSPFWRCFERIKPCADNSVGGSRNAASSDDPGNRILGITGIGSMGFAGGDGEACRDEHPGSKNGG